MKKFLALLGTVSLVLMCFASNASAKDMSRRLGIGVDSAMSQFAGEERGVSVVYAINKYFSMQLIFGMATYNAEVEVPVDDTTKKVDTTIIDWNLSIRALIPIVLSTDVNLSAVVGFSASGRSSDGFYSAKAEYQKYNDGYQFSIDLGIRPEWFVSEHFSLHTQIGIGINIITDNGSSVVPGLLNDNEQAYYTSKANGVNVDFFKNADLFGMAGFTFWF